MITFGLFLRAIALLANLILGVITYRRNPRSATNRLLALLTITIFLWGIANELSISASTSTQTLFWVRAVMFLAVPLTVLFFLLMYTFPRASLSIGKYRLAAIIFLSLVSMATASSPLLFTHIREGVGASAKPVPGPGVIIFLTTAVLAIVLGIAALVQKNFTLTGIQKLQARYLLIGTSIMFLLILGFIFFPVVLFDNTSFVSYSSLYVLPFIIATTYAIIRHRLMDIRAAIARSLSLSVLIGAVLLIYGVLLIFAVPYITDVTNLRGEIIAAAAALVSIPLAKYVQLALTRLTDRFLFQKQVDYRQSLVDVGKELSATIKIEDVTSTVLKAMRDILRSEKTIIFLKKTSGADFVPAASYRAGNITVSIPPDQALIKHLQHTPGPLVKDELTLQREQEQDRWHLDEMDTVATAFVWLDIAVAVPLYVNNQLTGLIALGDKLSGTPYLQDDLNFLSALAPQAATGALAFST